MPQELKMKNRIYCELKKIMSEPCSEYIVHTDNIDNDEGIYNWNLTIIGPMDTVYEGELLEATLAFPENYPWAPPVFTFKTDIWYPNVYRDKDPLVNGKVCISILHLGDDETGYESRSERWSPILNTNSIIQSIINLLIEPNPNSPANLDAAKELIQSNDTYLNTVKKCLVR